MNYIYHATNYTITSHFTDNVLRIYFTSYITYPPIILKYKNLSTTYLQSKYQMLSRFSPKDVILMFEHKNQIVLSEREYIFVTLMLQEEIKKFVDAYLFKNLVTKYGY